VACTTVVEPVHTVELGDFVTICMDNFIAFIALRGELTDVNIFGTIFTDFLL
jgi:hypothetical protein